MNPVQTADPVRVVIDDLLGRAAQAWVEMDGIYRKHPRLASFRPSCQCCSEILIRRYYGGEEAAKAWPRVRQLRAALEELRGQ